MHPLPKIKTFSALIEFIMMLACLPINVRRSLASNLRMFCKVVGIPPEAMQINVTDTRRLIDHAAWGAYDISPGNWAKIRSGVWRCHELAGIPVLRSTGAVLTPELEELLVGVPLFPDRTALTPLLKYLVTRDLSARQFCQEHIPDYRDWLKSVYTRTNWQRAFKRSISQWQSCQIDYPDNWPSAPLQIVFDEEVWVLQWTDMPELEDEIERHLQQCRTPRGRKYGAKRKVLSESTLHARKGFVSRMASAAVKQTSLDPRKLTLEILTRPDVADAAVEFCLARCGAEQNGNVGQMMVHATAIARHWVKRDDAELEELRNICYAVLPPKGPADKNVKLIEQFRNPALRERFLAFPSKLISKLHRQPTLSPDDATTFMLAFLAAFLTKVPLRISEVCALRFGTTIVDSGQLGSRQVIITVPQIKVLDGDPRRIRLGPKLVALMDKYIRHAKPLLADAANAFLFPGGDGDARSSDHLSRQLAELTSKEIGVRMTAHQWRHVVGYIFLLENPGCYEAVRKFLGHKSVITTVRYYAFMLEDDANEALDKTIDDLDDSSGRGRINSKGK